MEQPLETTIKFLRLNSGEDIVCEVQQVSDVTLQIHNPLKVVYALNENTGMVSVSLIQWVFPKISEIEQFELDKHNIVISSVASIDMTHYYYKSLDKIKKTTSVSKQYKSLVRDDYEEDEFEDIDDEALDYVKEMMEEVIKKNKRLH